MTFGRSKVKIQQRSRGAEEQRSTRRKSKVSSPAEPFLLLRRRISEPADLRTAEPANGLWLLCPSAPLLLVNPRTSEPVNLRAGYRAGRSLESSASPSPSQSRRAWVIPPCARRRDQARVSPTANTRRSDSQRFRNSSAVLPLRPAQVRDSERQLAIVGGDAHGALEVDGQAFGETAVREHEVSGAPLGAEALRHRLAAPLTTDQRSNHLDRGPNAASGREQREHAPLPLLPEPARRREQGDGDHERARDKQAGRHHAAEAEPVDLPEPRPNERRPVKTGEGAPSGDARRLPARGDELAVPELVDHNADKDGERRQRRQHVGDELRLRERKEDHHESGPDQEERLAAVLGEALARATPRHKAGQRRQQAGPRRAPQQHHSQEVPERLLALRDRGSVAKQMLVDKVEPEKVGVAGGGQHMPGNRDREEESDSGQPRHPFQDPPPAGREEVEKHDRARDHDPDQPLGKDRERSRAERPVPGGTPAPPVVRLLGDPETCQCRGEKERQRHVQGCQAPNRDPKRRCAERRRREKTGPRSGDRAAEAPRERDAGEAEQRAP